MAFQGIFRRTSKFIVVKQIRLSSKAVLAVGKEVDLKNTPLVQLRAWFKHRKIGVLGSPWAVAMIEGCKRPEGKVIHKADKVDENEPKKDAEKKPAKKKVTKKEPVKKAVPEDKNPWDE